MVEMADVNNADFICDPFCGVGGFVLEPLQIYPTLKNQYIPNKKSKKVKLLGYDKGSDEDEERIIILAKANMLIYISDIIEKNPKLTSLFSKYFNETFKLITDTNLGTLKIKFDKEEEKPDLILSNPPYVKKGSRSLRDEIKEENLENEYKNSGVGVEGLALKWIINNLRCGGNAFVIIPNGILDNLGNDNLRNEIKTKCYINALISLPVKTFFNTPKKTYILGIEKKEDENDIQDFPVFTYLVSNIGEKLDVNRFEIEENDLEKAKNLYNQFKGSKQYFQVDDPRCKLIEFSIIEKEKYWIIENFWDERELINLKIKKEKSIVSIKQYNVTLSFLIENIKDSKEKINEIEKEVSKVRFKKTKINEILDIYLGNAKYTKNYINENSGDFPVYSAQTLDEMGIGKINSYDWDTEGLTWSVDGLHAGRVFYRKGKFSMTCHTGLLLIKEDFKNKLDYKFLLYVLDNHLPNFTKGVQKKRLKKNHLEEDVEHIKIPIKQNGEFDLDKQKEIANKYETIEKIKKKIKTDYEKVIKQGISIN